MKILHIISGISPKSGGPTIFLKDLIIRQKLNGHNPSLLTFLDSDFLNSSIHNEIKESGIDIFLFESFNQYKLSLRFFVWLQKNIINYECIHIHGIFRFPVDISLLLSPFWKVPTIFSPHGALDKEIINISNKKFFGIFCKKLIIFLLKNSLSKIFFHFTTFLEKESCVYTINNKKSFIVPIGVEIPKIKELNSEEIRSKLSITKDTFLIGYLGRLQYKKNLISLIKAFKLFIDEYKIKSKLILIGPSEAGYKEILIRLVEELGLKEKVIFINFVDHKKIFCFLNAMDLYALPSFTENFGISIIESLAVGTPVLISNRVNIYKLVEDNNCGVVVETDKKSILKGFVTIYKKIYAHKKNIKKNALCMVKDNFSWNQIIKKYNSVYEKVIE